MLSSSLAPASTQGCAPCTASEIACKAECHVSCAQKARKQREEAKQRKEENQRKSMVVQAVTNPKTLKKMMASKKERKKLMKADTLKSVG